MAPKWSWKQGDTNPYETTLTDDRTDTTWQLAGGTITFTLSRPTPSGMVTVINKAPATFVSPTLRTVKFSPTAQQTILTPGTYWGEWEWLDAQGVRRTFPSNGFDEIQIFPQLA